MSVGFHTLTIIEIVPETAEAHSIRFAVPEALRETFKFKPGQHLTLKAEIEGEEIRRNYSLCVAPQDDQVMVTVKRIAGGVFSNWANDTLKPGMPVEVMAPHGSFTWDFDPGAANHYVGFAGGSGITPVMSLLKTALLTEPRSRFTLFYGNRDSNSIIFLEALAQLKNSFMDRLQVHHFLAEEAEEFDLFNGMLDRSIPVLFAYWSKPEHGAKVSRFLNDHIADLVARYPKNYIGLATLPMQDTAAAIEELKHAKQSGHLGIQIGSNINGKNLSDAELFPIFEACADLGMAIMVHPWEMMGENDMRKYWLPWLVGMPAETSRAACSMIFGGVLERLPHLRVCFSHAGGSFLPTLGRVEHGFNCRPDLVAIDNPVNPREYLGKFWVDSITHDIDMLEYILKMQGSKRVCLGSDYPFPLGDLEIGKFIEDSNLSKEVQEDIFANATAEWLNISAEKLRSFL